MTRALKLMWWSLPAGSEASSGSVGPSANFLRRHVQYHRRVRHRHLEWGSPQDRVRLQLDRPRLPRPGPLGQCPGRAEGSGHHRGGVFTKRLNPECVKQCQSSERQSCSGNHSWTESPDLKRTRRWFYHLNNFSKLLAGRLQRRFGRWCFFDGCMSRCWWEVVVSIGSSEMQEHCAQTIQR